MLYFPTAHSEDSYGTRLLGVRFDHAQDFMPQGSVDCEEKEIQSHEALETNQLAVVNRRTDAAESRTCQEACGTLVPSSVLFRRHLITGIAV